VAHGSAVFSARTIHGIRGGITSFDFLFFEVNYH
jgi:hypothetical protein